MIRIAVVGTGLIGRERLSALQRLQRAGWPVSIAGIFDLESKSASELAKLYSTNLYLNYREVIDSRPDWIFLATPHDVAVELTNECVESGIRAFVEKPLGRTSDEARSIALKASPNMIHVGYNYRFLEGIRTLLSDVRSGLFGDMISANLILAHGHNPDMKGSWKLDPARAGGGCLIDPGVHLLDLCQILSGSELQVLSATAWNGFWNAGIEEECHILLRDKNGLIFNLQISIVRWRSTFAVEVNGTNGYGKVIGRGRSFGTQRYIRGKRWGWTAHKTQAESETQVCETDGADAFFEETKALLFSAPGEEPHPCTLAESLKTMELLDRCRAVAKIQ